MKRLETGEMALRRIGHHIFRLWRAGGRVDGYLDQSLDTVWTLKAQIRAEKRKLWRRKMSDGSTMNHSLMCECGHVSGGHYYNPSLSGFDRCINCECKQFRLSCFKPTQTSPERAELQVSLLNALSDEQRRNQELTTFTLKRIENALFEQAETLKTYKLSLEGIQGLLVDNEAEIGALGAKLDAHDGHLTAIDIASYEGTQRILKERGERLDRIDAMLERIVTEIDHVAKRYSHVAARLAHIEGRLDNAMGKFIWLDARGEARLATALEAINLRLPERPVTVKRKPSLRPVSRKKRKR